MAGSLPNSTIPIPDLNQWLMSTLALLSANINCHTIGSIVSLDADTQTANVQINYLRVIKGANPNLPNPAPNDQASDIYKIYPLLVKCPVIIPRSGGAYINMPISVGDPCLLLFNDREIDTWFATGQVTYPQNSRTHDLNDAFVLLGMGNMLNKISGYSSNTFSLNYKGAVIEIDNDGNISVASASGKNITVTGENVTITGLTQVAINP